MVEWGYMVQKYLNEGGEAWSNAQCNHGVN